MFEVVPIDIPFDLVPYEGARLGQDIVRVTTGRSSLPRSANESLIGWLVLERIQTFEVLQLLRRQLNAMTALLRLRRS